jgi:type IV secretory pathway VirB6-like protein
VGKLLIAGLSALISVIIAYGAVASTIVGLLGPIFIPFLVFDKLEFLFWGWLRAFLGFSFYKVVAAATLSVLSQLLTNYYAMMSGFVDPGKMIQELPTLILLVMVNGFILLKIPAMTATIFSGHTGGHDSGLGVAMMATQPCT